MKIIDLNEAGACENIALKVVTLGSSSASSVVCVFLEIVYEQAAYEVLA